MIGRAILRFTAPLVFAALGCLPGGPLKAESGDAPNRPLEFRRIYAPTDRIGDWPLEKGGYLPIDAGEFQRLVELAREGSEGVPPSGAALVDSTYEARLVGDELVGGSARLQILDRDDGPTVLGLGPCSLSLSRPTWIEEPPRAAIVGLEASGELGVQVDRSGTLGLDWTIRGRRDAAGAVTFDIRLPACSRKQLLLDLPADVLPVADQGVVTQSPGTAPDRSGWKIELGGHSRLSLRVASESTLRARRQLTLLRQTVIYDFSLKGVEVAVELALDVHHQPLHEITLAIDPSLRLMAARYGEKEIPWTQTAGEKSNPSEVVLHLPEPIQGSGKVVRLVSVAPLATGRPWRLPAIETKGMFWAEGNVRLLVPAPLSLDQLSLSGCRQTKVEPLPAQRAGELIELQQFSPAATAEVTIGRREGRVEVRQGTTIDAGPGELAGRTQAEFRMDGSERFSIAAEVSSDWIIDDVASWPSGRVADWTVEPGPTGVRKLTVHLSKALNSKRPLRLAISGRSRRSALEERLVVGDCRMLKFADAHLARHLMLVRAIRPFQLHVGGDEKPVPLDPDDLDMAEAALLDDEWQGVLFALDAETERMSFSLKAEKPRYAGEVRFEVSVAGETLTESYDFRCAPESARVERLLIHFSQARPEPPRWSLGGEGEPQLKVRRLGSREQGVSDMGSQGETWEVELRRPRSVPFELHAVRSIAFTSQIPLSLAALPDATGREGTLTVRTLNEANVILNHRQLEPIPADSTFPDQYPLARATYRYEASPDFLASPDAQITVAPGRDELLQPLAWVWNCRLDSRYGANGTVSHLATYEIQNAGRRRAMIVMPAKAKVQAVWINETRVPQRLTSDYGQQLSLDLPSGQKFPVIAVHFDVAGSPLGFWQTARPLLPKIDLPTVVQQWTLWLPPDYTTLDHPSSLSGLRPSWRKRLFGPLARAPKTRAFDPAQASHWVGLVDVKAATTNGSQVAGQFLARLGAALNSSRTQSPLTWGTIVQEAGGLAVSDEPPVFIDREALARLGITRRRTVTPPRPGSEVERAVALLEKADLALLVHRRALIVTSAVSAAVYRAWLTPLYEGPLFNVRGGPLDGLLQARLALPESGPLVGAKQWANGGSVPPVPWNSTSHVTADVDGWTASRVADFSDTSTAVRIVRRGAIHSLAWVGFLVACALGCWKLLEHPRALIATLGVTAAAALVAPTVLVPVISGIFLGTLGSLVVGLVRRRGGEGSLDKLRGATDFVITARAKTVVAIASASIAVAAAQAAAEEHHDQERPGSEIHKVFIPIDSERRPTGDKYYISESFHRELNRRAAAVRRSPSGWMITKAFYQGTLSRETAERRLTVDRLKATFDLRVFAQRSTIRIPLGGEDAALLPEGAKLDGRPIQVAWESDRRALTFQVDEPGQYEMSLALAPTLRTTSSATGFDLTIPSLATSQLELSFPEDASELQLPTVRGAIVPSAPRGTLRADLGPADRLIVRWPEGDQAPAVEMEVDQLVWLKIQPGAVVLDARLKVKVIAGRTQRLNLVADSHLRLLPFAEDSPVAAVRSEPGQPQTYGLDLKRAVSDEVVIDARLLLSGTSGVGKVRLPQLSVLGARTTRRLLAVSIDAALEYEEDPIPKTSARELTPLTAADFASAWGDPAAKPLLAYHVLNEDSLWSMATRPHQTHTQADQSLALTLGRQVAGVRYEARLDTTSGYHFQHRLSAPPELIVDSISVREENSERAARWSRDARGALTIFLTGPVSGVHRVSLRGRLPLPDVARFPAPVIELEHSGDGRREIRVFRQTGVLVEIQPAKAMEADGEQLIPLQTPDGPRLVGHYLLARRGEPLWLVVTPNETRVSGTLVTSVQRNVQTWQVEADYHIRVRKGVLDVLRLEVPSSWRGPFQVDPPAEVRLATVPGERRQQLIIRPSAAIDEQYRVRISGPLKLAPGDRVHVPRIAPVGVGRIERYVILPRQSEDQQSIRWETRGLQATVLPPGSSRPGQSLAAVEAYQVVGEQFQALPAPLGSASKVPQVRLSYVGVAWTADGRCQGVATFDLEPAGLSSFTLNLPKGCQLLHATAAGLPAMLEPIDSPNTLSWRMTLGPGRLPQRIEVVFTGTISRRHGQVALRGPVLSSGGNDVYVERTLWTVFGPASAGAALPLERARLITGARQELVRLESIAPLMDLDPEVANDYPADQVAHWYRPWARRLLSFRDAVQAEAATSAAPEPPVEEARALALVREQLDVARRLGTSSVLANLMAQEIATVEVTQLWQRSVEAGAPSARFSFPGAVPSLTLRYGRGSSGETLQRWGAAAALLVATGVLVIAGRRWAWSDAVWRWPHAWAMAAGLCWWLWLAPSVFGWIIMGLCLASSLRRGWRPAPASDSTVLKNA